MRETSLFKETPEIFNNFLSTAASNLEIDYCETSITDDPICKALKKYEMHPSIKKRTESICKKINFSSVSCDDMKSVVDGLHTYRSVPTKVFKQTSHARAHTRVRTHTRTRTHNHAYTHARVHIHARTHKPSRTHTHVHHSTYP